MKKTNVSPMFAVLVAALAISLLAACGGGGGGGGAPAPIPTPTTVTVNCPDGTTATGATTADANNACPAPKLISITPADGDKTVSPDSFTGITVATSSQLDPSSVNTNNIKLMIGTSTTIAGNVSMSADGKGFKFVPTAKLSYAQVYDKFTATVKDTLGKVLTVTSSFTTAPVQCFSPNVWDGTSCNPPTTTVLHYTDKVYALWTGAYPFAVTKTGVTKVVNKTHYAGSRPFYNCWLAEKPLADGKVLASCKYSVDNTRNVYYIDPTKDEIYDYAGTVPADNVWHDVVAFDPSTPTWGAKAKVADGWYFTTNTVTWVLNFQADASGAITTVKAGTFAVDETVNLLMSYSN